MEVGSGHWQGHWQADNSAVFVRCFEPELRAPPSASRNLLIFCKLDPEIILNILNLSICTGTPCAPS